MSVSGHSFNLSSEASSVPTSSKLSSAFAMLQPSCSQASAWLHQVVGYGRFGESNEVVLKLSAAPDFEHPPVLQRIALTLEGQPVFAWVAQAAWLEWLTPILPVPDAQSLTSDIQEAALNWTLAPWLDWCARHHLATPNVSTEEVLKEPMALDTSTPLTLSLISQDEEHPRCLTLYLDGFSTDWLHSLALTLEAAAPVAAGNIEGYAMAGISKLNIAQVQALEVGDVLMFWWQASLEDGMVWLTFAPASSNGFTRGIVLRRSEKNQFEVESVMEDYEEEQEGGPSLDTAASENKTEEMRVVDALPITLTFEIGRMTLPLSALTTLQVGDMLDAQFKASPEIGIRAQGRLIAAGKLVQIGDTLGAKITRLVS